jgi:4-hydroxy-tetrahydrodipicolinate synthase
LFTESNPVPLKAALAMLNLATTEVRLPLLRAGEATKEKLAEAMAPVMSQEEWIAAHPRYALAS